MATQKRRPAIKILQNFAGGLIPASRGGMPVCRRWRAPERNPTIRHCGRSEAIQGPVCSMLDCVVALSGLLAMMGLDAPLPGTP